MACRRDLVAVDEEDARVKSLERLRRRVHQIRWMLGHHYEAEIVSACRLNDVREIASAVAAKT